MIEVSIWFALAAGILSFFSPCVFPLLPAYITHLTGGNIENNKLVVNRKALAWRSTGFIIGFSVIFIVMGGWQVCLGNYFLNIECFLSKLLGS